MKRKVSTRAALMLCAALPSLTPAIAQTHPAAADPGPEERATGSDTDIIVTARRREENIQDVPIAVSAFGGQALQEQNITNIETPNGRVPGLTTAPVSGSGRTAPAFSMRGQSQQEVGAIADPAVSLYVNDVPVPRAQGANLGIFDIASVEVLKGPQGTLFGRNTPGGAILIRPQLPKDHFEAFLSQTIGNYGLFTTEGMINLPLGESLSFRLAAQRVRRDGWIIDEITGKDVNSVEENAFRASLRIAPPSSPIESTTLFAYSTADNGGTGGFLSFTLNPLAMPLLPGLRDRPFRHIVSGQPMFARIRNWSIDNTTTLELNDRQHCRLPEAESSFL